MFYDEKMQQVENNSPPTIGKSQLLALELSNLKKVQSVNTKITDWVYDEDKDIAWGQMTIVFTTTDNTTKQFEEAFQQKWKGSKIIYQRFFYCP